MRENAMALDYTASGSQLALANSNIFVQIAPFLAAAGNELINADENESGADDFAGQLLVYSAEVSAAIVSGEDIPPLPEIIARGTSDRITGAPKIVLRIASSALTIAQFKLTGKAATALKYINQAIRALLAGRPVGLAPSILQA